MLHMLHFRTKHFQAFPDSDWQCMQHGCDMWTEHGKNLTGDTSHFKLVPNEAIASLSNTTSANGQNQPRTKETVRQG